MSPLSLAAVDPALTSAFIGAGAAVLVAAGAPILERRAARKAEVREKQESLLVRLRGFRSAIPQMRYLRYSLLVWQSAAHHQFRWSVYEDDPEEMERAERSRPMYQADAARFGDQAHEVTLRLADLHRALDEALAELPHAFALTQEIRSLVAKLQERRVAEQILGGDFFGPQKGRIGEWAGKRLQEAEKLALEPFDGVMAELLDALARQLPGGVPQPAPEPAP